MVYNYSMKNDLQKKANLIRKWCLISTTEAGSGHPTSCLSAADVMTVIFDKYFTYDLENPDTIANDRFILSKGHAAPIMYSLYAAAGAIPFEELKTLRKFGSRLEGHPTPRFPYADFTTGSLGQGLSMGAGMALTMQREQGLSIKPHVYVLMGDGELAEGQVWEAANFASYYKLNNLIAIADINRLGQSQETMIGHRMKEYEKRFTAFGWKALVIDGHDFTEIGKAVEEAVHNTSAQPVVILAQTHKGHGISFLQDKEGWHGKPLPKEELEKALAELGDIEDEPVFRLRVPSQTVGNPEVQKTSLQVSYTKGEQIGTREVYGKTLADLGKENPAIVALDAEVKNSTYSIDFMKAFPHRFVECFIAEQNMVSVASGIARLGKKPFVSTFAAFLSRAYDQIRMARLSNADIKFVGSHAGVSIGEDGASQMGLEDFAMFGAFPDSVILHPSDAVSTAKLLEQMVAHDGITYLRTLRPKTQVIYDAAEEFEIGGSKVLRADDMDVLTVAAAGITVPEALQAYEALEKEGIHIRVIDCYSIKPVDKATLLTAASETQKQIIITVEDHFAHGGLGDFILEALANEHVTVEKMAVTHISRSGKGSELLDDAGISARHIIEKVKSLLK